VRESVEGSFGTVDVASRSLGANLAAAVEKGIVPDSRRHGMFCLHSRIFGDSGGEGIAGLFVHSSIRHHSKGRFNCALHFDKFLGGMI
jgi:hypothetical protein